MSSGGAQGYGWRLALLGAGGAALSLAWWLFSGVSTPVEVPGPAARTETTEAAPSPSGPRLAAVWEVELDGAAEATRPAFARMSLAPIDGRQQVVRVRFDEEAAVGELSLAELRESPDWVAGVRLLLGEVGAWRLVENRWALLEGVGILETVNNRFVPDLANPLRRPGVKDWPGCGDGTVFATCIDPAQYRGLATERALRPTQAVPDEALLREAVERAVLAWWLFEESLLGEITAGATSFVHACGAPSYGVERCASGDTRRGPVLFRGPGAWSKQEGRYTLDTLASVDFEAGPAPVDARAYPNYLLGRGR